MRFFSSSLILDWNLILKSVRIIELIMKIFKNWSNQSKKKKSFKYDSIIYFRTLYSFTSNFTIFFLILKTQFSNRWKSSIWILFFFLSISKKILVTIIYGINLKKWDLNWIYIYAFANGPGDLVSIPGRIIPKTLKVILDITLFNTQQYKVRIKGKVEQSRERSRALLYTSVL